MAFWTILDNFLIFSSSVAISVAFSSNLCKTRHISLIPALGVGWFSDQNLKEVFLGIMFILSTLGNSNKKRDK